MSQSKTVHNWIDAGKSNRANAYIHPSGDLSDEAYWDSGRHDARRIEQLIGSADTVLECAEGYHPSIDLRLWRKWSGSKLSWRDEAGTQSLCVGIKGVEGRQSRGWRPSRTAVKDADASQLRLWVGKDSGHYLTSVTAERHE